MPLETEIPTVTDPTTTPTATVTPTPTATSTPTAPTASPDPKVETSIPFDQLRLLLEQKAELDRRLADEARRREEAEARAIQKDIENQNSKGLMERLAAKEKADAERRDREYNERLEAERARYASENSRLSAEKAAAESRAKAVEHRAKKYTLERDLSQALAGHNLVPGGAQQLAALWANELNVIEDGEAYATRSGDGKSVADFVAARLAQQEYSHFIRATVGQGGTLGGRGSSSVTPTTTPPPEIPVPANMGEAALLHQKYNATAVAYSATDMSKGFGLRPLAGR